jgi:competence ComEA-like helix-hairpin-helix protein
VLGLWAFVVFGLAVRAFARGVIGESTACPIEIEPITIDVNRAAVGELRVLPGIGAVRAEAIVLERVRNGPFRRIEDLDRVDGLGPETVEELRPFVRVGGTDQRPR